MRVEPAGPYFRPVPKGRGAARIFVPVAGFVIVEDDGGFSASPFPSRDAAQEAIDRRN